MYKYLEINYIRYLSLLLQTLNVPLQIGKFTPGCEPRYMTYIAYTSTSQPVDREVLSRVPRSIKNVTTYRYLTNTFLEI